MFSEYTRIKTGLQFICTVNDGGNFFDRCVKKSFLITSERMNKISA